MTSPKPNNRISIEDSPQQIIIKMCEGNPGGLNVLISLLRESSNIDPDDALAPYGTVLALDAMGIYGSKIWILFKDVCGGNIVRLVGLFRANQLGYVSEQDIFAAISAVEKREPVQLDLTTALAKVCGFLPKFGGTHRSTLPLPIETKE